MFSNGPLHIAEQKQDDQLELTHSSSVRIRGAALKTCRMQWMIGRGGERGSGISSLIARQDENRAPIPARRSNQVWINKKVNLSSSGFYHSSRSTGEDKRKQKERQILRPCQRTKKQWNMRMTVIQIVVHALGLVPKCLEKKLEKLRIKGRIKTIQTTTLNSQKSPGDLRKLAVTSEISERTPTDAGVKNSQGVKLLCFYLPNPSTMNRIWHEVSFYAEYNWFELKFFLLIDWLPN